MRSFDQLARAAYEEHVKHLLKHRPHLQAYLPTWESLDPVLREAWVAGTQQVLAEYAVVL